LLTENCDRIDGELERLEKALQDGLNTASDKLSAARAELQSAIESKVSDLSRSTDNHFAATEKDIKEKDGAINKRVDDLAVKTEMTFKGMNGRMEAAVKEERSRFGNIERDIQETNAKLRSDFRAEVERVRTDYEQEAARLDADLADLHMKHDVTKQEITFFQSRLAEQRDWAQRQFTETTTATRAAQCDAQEAQAAAMKMLQTLKDDVVTFRDKMGKYVSMLQHSSDVQGDAINTLEAHRARIRLELDALIGDHKSYTSDMDGWADDVRVKVERLFRAMEPARAEWRIFRAERRAKELKRPLAVKSPTFALRGLREVQMEFYPEGTTGSPVGKAILRMYMPPGAKLKYQVYLGRISPGPAEYAFRQEDGNVFVDVEIENWMDEIKEDGALPVIVDVLQDHTNDDESLAREVRIESP